MPNKPTVRATKTAGFEVVEHTADWALRVYAPNLEQLLVIAALGMGSLLVDDLNNLPLDVERCLELEAFDAETLLVDWLGELAYWAEAEQLVFREFHLENVTDTYLEATVHGGRADELLKHIKAVTYHNLEIVTGSEGLSATVIFDV